MNHLGSLLRSNSFFLYATGIIVFLIFLLRPGAVLGETALELQQKIGAKSASISELEREIAKYNKELLSIGAEATTLEREIAVLDTTRKKLQLEVNATQAKIDKAELTVRSLGDEIGGKEEHIRKNREALGAATQALAREDDRSLMEILFTSERMSSVMRAHVELLSFTGAIDASLAELRKTRATLVDNQAEVSAEKQKLEALRKKVADQKKIADNARKEQATLLATTKNEEGTYRNLLATKEREIAAVEAEIRAFETELRTIIDRSKLPGEEVATGSLAWPLKPVRITQPFGDTEFSRTHSQVYSGKGHNGTDFGGSVGTELWSARRGTVRGVGDTDLTCKGASYGKWVLIDHDNGLSTLYAHLSLVKAVRGQVVATGDLVGYLGRTGYATGPHLHFTVYATEGVQIGQLKSKVPGCGTYTMPLASLESYLDPMEYLPRL